MISTHFHVQNIKTFLHIQKSRATIHEHAHWTGQHFTKSFLLYSEAPNVKKDYNNLYTQVLCAFLENRKRIWFFLPSKLTAQVPLHNTAHKQLT